MLKGKFRNIIGIFSADEHNEYVDLCDEWSSSSGNDVRWSELVDNSEFKGSLRGNGFAVISDMGDKLIMNIVNRNMEIIMAYDNNDRAVGKNNEAVI